MFEPDEKVGLITAASRGTAGVITPALGRAGATVVLAAGRRDRRRPTLGEIAANGGTACARALDPASRRELAALAAALATLDDEEPTWEDAEWR